MKRNESFCSFFEMTQNQSPRGIMSVLETAIRLRRAFTAKARTTFGFRVAWVGNTLCFTDTGRPVPNVPRVSLGLRP